MEKNTIIISFFHIMLFARIMLSALYSNWSKNICRLLDVIDDYSQNMTHQSAAGPRLAPSSPPVSSPWRPARSLPSLPDHLPALLLPLLRANCLPRHCPRQFCLKIKKFQLPTLQSSPSKQQRFALCFYSN